MIEVNGERTDVNQFIIVTLNQGLRHRICELQVTIQNRRRLLDCRQEEPATAGN